MRTLRLFGLVVLVALSLLMASPAGAITYGEPDINDHPYVGVMIFLVGEDYYQCSGSLITSTVFLTAGHCTFGASKAWISFDYEPDYANFPKGWLKATPIPHYNYDGLSLPNTYDVGVALLSKPVAMSRYGQLPTAGFLDDLATRRGTQEVSFTTVGYGVESYKPVFQWSGNRGQATADLVNLRSALTDGYNLMTTNNPGDDRGGNCSGDSGGPILYGDSDLIVAVNSFGIAPYCKGNDYGYRVDISDARAFLDDYVAVP
jgi:hypothetical protein